MSGRPNPNQISELLQCVELVRKFDDEADRLATLIAESQKQLERVGTSRRANAERACKLLAQMDCVSGGNLGYEGRIVWLLAELVAQAQTPKPPQAPTFLVTPAPAPFAIPPALPPRAP